MDTVKLLHEAHLRYQRQMLRAQRNDITLPSGNVLEYDELRGIVRRQTKSMLRDWRSVSYYKLFCDHDIPRWQCCSSTLCRRTQADGDVFLMSLLNARRTK